MAELAKPCARESHAKVYRSIFKYSVPLVDLISNIEFSGVRIFACDTLASQRFVLHRWPLVRHSGSSATDIRNLFKACSRIRIAHRLFVFICVRLDAQGRWAFTFFIDKKVNKKSRQNNHSQHTSPSHPRYFALPARLDGDCSI